MTVSRLLSARDNPLGYGWGIVAIESCGAAILLWTLFVSGTPSRASSREVATGHPAPGIRILSLGRDLHDRLPAWIPLRLASLPKLHRDAHTRGVRVPLLRSRARGPRPHQPICRAAGVAQAGAPVWSRARRPGSWARRSRSANRRWAPLRLDTECKGRREGPRDPHRERQGCRHGRRPDDR